MHSKQILNYFTISENFFCFVHVLAIYDRASFHDQLCNQLSDCNQIINCNQLSLRSRTQSCDSVRFSVLKVV